MWGCCASVWSGLDHGNRFLAGGPLWADDSGRAIFSVAFKRFPARSRTENTQTQLPRVLCSGALYACLYLSWFIAAEPALRRVPRYAITWLAWLVNIAARYISVLIVESLLHSMSVRKEPFLVEEIFSKRAMDPRVYKP